MLESRRNLTIVFAVFCVFVLSFAFSTYFWLPQELARLMPDKAITTVQIMGASQTEASENDFLHEEEIEEFVESLQQLRYTLRIPVEEDGESVSIRIYYHDGTVLKITQSRISLLEIDGSVSAEKTVHLHETLEEIADRSDAVNA